MINCLFENCRKTAKDVKKAFKEPQKKTLLLLIILSGLFCLRSFAIFPSFYALINADPEDKWIAESIIGSKNSSLTINAGKKREIISRFSDYYLATKDEEDEDLAVSDLESELQNLVGNYPIGEMVPYISAYERQVAALVIGIAKKESDWGRRSPSKGGQDCYNYWGYKGSGANGTALGYACFASVEEAVRIVGGRIEHFVGKNLDTPSRMVIWKCGSSCSWDDPRNVAKWISDVSVYYNQIAYAK